MKKLSVFLSVVLIAALLCVGAFAAPFVRSPGAAPGPELVEYESESPDCTADLIITPFSHRDELDTDLRSMIMTAYDEIRSVEDITSLNSALVALAQRKGIPSKNLAVSELFDVHYVHCDVHDAHGNFKIKVSSESSEKFVALLHYYNGTWELIDNARIEDGYLVFSIKDFSPFAIVVDNSENVADAGTAETPLTGNMEGTIKIAVLATVMCGSLIAGIILWKKSKKQAA